MKKGLLLLVIAGAFLVSCGGNGELEKEAAKEFCDCYSELATAKKEAASATNTSDIFGTIKKMKELALKAKKCQSNLDSKYEGKLDLDTFKAEVKKENKDVYDMAVEEKAF